MKIVRPDKLVKVDNTFFKPHARYVVSDYELDYMMYNSPHTEWNWSSFNSFERRYGGQDLNGKKVCIYRHNACGDQLIASSVPRYLKTLYPEAKIDMYCHPTVMSLWLGNAFVGGTAVPLPMPFDALQQYDYHILYEGMLEGNSEPDQRCCYDDLFGVIGLHDVPDHYKRPYITLLPADYVYFMKSGIDKLKPYMVYHMSPDNENRRYAPEKAVQFIGDFCDKYLKHHVLIVGMDKKRQYDKHLHVFKDHSRVHNLIDRTPSFRDLIPIIENADLVVCPDSAILHLAACFDHVPVVSLWGPFAPRDRMQYYPNSFPIFNPDACPHAACHDHGFELPVESCKDATSHGLKEKIKHCLVLDSISSEQILASCKEALG